MLATVNIPVWVTLSTIFVVYLVGAFSFWFVVALFDLDLWEEGELAVNAIVAALWFFVALILFAALCFRVLGAWSKLCFRYGETTREALTGSGKPPIIKQAKGQPDEY